MIVHYLMTTLNAAGKNLFVCEKIQDVTVKLLNMIRRTEVTSLIVLRITNV